MPPIPSMLDEGTTSLIASVQRKQKDIADFQIPRLRTCKGPLAVQQQLATELREDLDAFTRHIEVLDIAVDDQASERDRQELRQIVDEFRDALTSLRKDTRAAVLASKRVIDANQLSSREELLRSSAVTEKQTLNEKVTEDALMKANNDVTEALQRTINLMQGELERSVLSSQLLDSSTAALRSTSSTHDVLDGLMSASKQLITALEKSDWLDRLLILAGLAFFLLVVLFILKQRLVDRGLRIALWWTRFVPDFSGDAGLVRMEEGEVLLKTVVEAASTVVLTASSVAATATSLAVHPSEAVEESLPPLDTSILDILGTSSTSTVSSPSPGFSGRPEFSDGVESSTHDEL
ncbi:Sec20-domain-containing protein [Sparassis latifolia]